MTGSQLDPERGSFINIRLKFPRPEEGGEGQSGAGVEDGKEPSENPKEIVAKRNGITPWLPI